MKMLTKEEFEDRTKAVLRAEKIFVDSGITNNITTAFELYQAVLADREREIRVSPTEHGFIPGSPLNSFKRPLCPDCNTAMMFRTVPANDEGVKTQLVCNNADCQTVLDSEKTMEEWIALLERNDEPAQRLLKIINETPKA